MKFNVTMLNKDDFANNGFFRKFGEFATICYDTPLTKAVQIGKHCLKAGHFSGSRHIYFAFHIDLPRSSADQISRHEQGVVKNMQSQRYVNKSDFTYYTSEGILENPVAKEAYDNEMQNIMKAYTDIVSILNEEGIKGEHANEQARGILPMGVESKLALAVNVEGLIHLAHKRLCTRTQEHTRKIVKMMVKEVLKVTPELEEYLVPQCKAMFYCPEDEKNCPMMKSGYMINKTELQRITQDARKDRKSKPVEYVLPKIEK